MGRVRVVTRHSGAVAWLARQGIDAAAESVFDPLSLRPGETIIGNLPAHVAAAVTAGGGRYVHLALDLPPAWRGRDLSADDMEKCGARLTPLHILPDPRPLPIGPTVSPRPPAGASCPITLVTLLGTPPKGDYQTYDYRLGTASARSRWMPEALVRLRADGPNPIRRLIVIGTKGSGWDILARVAGLDGSALEFDLFAGVATDAAMPAAVIELTGHLARHLGLDEVLPLIVPYADEQNAYLVLAAQLAAILRSEQNVVFDITFGLRDVMLTAFTATLALEHLANIKLADVVYAAIKTQTEQRAEIVSIGAIPQIIAWVRALSVLKTTGDMRPLLTLLPEAHALSDLIARQSVDERMLRPRRAAERARHLLSVAEADPTPTTALFLGVLRERLDWARIGRRTSALQAALSRRALADGDLGRATALGFEACVSAFAERELGWADASVEDPDQRAQAQVALNARARSGRHAIPADRDYLMLKDVRNVLLHASRPSKPATAALLNDPGALADLIARTLAARIGSIIT